MTSPMFAGPCARWRNLTGATRAAASWGRTFRLPLGALMLAALAACNGKAVVTLTSTPSTDTFLAYRVGLKSVQLQSGSKTVNLLSTATTVDLAQLVNLSEIVGASSAQTGNFKQVVVTLDYGSAQIVYDNGTPEGLALTPLSPGGEKMGEVSMTLYLDPNNELGIVHSSYGRLSLAFNLAASNVVNASAKTVTVQPLMEASAIAIDSKTVRIRGPLSNVSTANTSFSMGFMPFDFGTSESGSLNINPTSVTTYEINGTPSTGNTGLTQLASLSSGTVAVAYGTLTTSSATSNSLLNGTTDTTDTTSTTTGTTETCSDGTTPETVNNVLECTDGSTLETTSTDENTGSTSTTITTVSFSATQVLAGSSAQGGGFDRITGVVTGRSGNTLTVDDGTLLQNDGTNTLIQGTTTVNVGPNTAVTQFGSGAADSTGITEISVGSTVSIFGTASSVGSTSAALDASSGRTQLWQTTASGLVTGSPTSSIVELSLTQLGGRAVSVFDFAGTGPSGSDANPSSYQVTGSDLNLSNAAAGDPIEASGYITAFGASGAGLTATQSLLDYTTISATLVVDFTGTTAPFASYDTSQMVLNAQNGAIGARHEIQTGAQIVSVAGLASNVQIIPNATATNTVFTIGHVVSGTYENFNTFSAFVTQLETELTGSILVNGITAIGQYTSSNYTFSASSMTITLNN
jgi:trimeric autotransporter adhesin